LAAKKAQKWWFYVLIRIIIESIKAKNAHFSMLGAFFRYPDTLFLLQVCPFCTGLIFFCTDFQDFVHQIILNHFQPGRIERGF